MNEVILGASCTLFVNKFHKNAIVIQAPVFKAHLAELQFENPLIWNCFVSSIRELLKIVRQLSSKYFIYLCMSLSILFVNVGRLIYIY